jgi:hypothetical protein
MAEPEGLHGLITSETCSRWPQRGHEEKRGGGQLLGKEGGAGPYMRAGSRFGRMQVDGNRWSRVCPRRVKSPARCLIKERRNDEDGGMQVGMRLES